ncbi:MAG: hypothetical protein IH621_16400 [Krumholzibacteria bacterium]|nr:hypothetical protein [Candidatus Krumholzibacteria bacterium]
MSRLTTLLTAHKGVDLHAATAVRVMRERLEGGDRLVALHRCELHTYGDGIAGGPGDPMARLLDNGRYFNPNKHHYGHFELADAGPWGRPARRRSRPRRCAVRSGAGRPGGRRPRGAPA